MAERRPGGSVRVRATAGAVLVVAAALLAGALVLVFLVREQLHDAAQATAEQRAAALAAQIASTGLPAPEPAGPSGDEDDDEPGDLVWQVTDAGGTVVRASGPSVEPLPAADGDEVRLPGAEDRYVLATETTGAYAVTVAASLEEVDSSTEALVTPLLAGLPLLLLLVGGTTWTVVARALSPVERIRREVEEITGDRLDRRVPEPAARDEIHRLARTMNRMLGRLEAARDRQQQFVADASHELRSPLASIRQAAEVARDHPGALADGELTDAVLEESARMQRLVDQLLLLTRSGDGAVPRAWRDVDLDDLALAEARRIGADTAGVGPARVHGDPAALAQVVRNLADNAARHARERVALTVRATGGGAELVVEDDGHGIPADQRERVFDRFVRLDEARARDAGGSGLGLAIVREIVTAHGGTVTVTGSALGGARFVVRFR